MKKVITIIVIVILALGFGYYLYTISDTTSGQAGVADFDLGNVKPSSEIRGLQATDHVLGNPEAKNIIVAYEDIQCPACKAFEPTLKALTQELRDTKVVYRHFPLFSVHKNASEAAYAAEAAAAQGKFWEWVTLAYERQESWSGSKNPIENFVAIARDSGVGDLEKFRSETENKTYRERIQTDIREAISLDVNATPTLYFNGVKLEVTGLAGLKQQAEKLYKQ